jgi:hypothetical protein
LWKKKQKNFKFPFFKFSATLFACSPSVARLLQKFKTNKRFILAPLRRTGTHKTPMPALRRAEQLRSPRHCAASKISVDSKKLHAAAAAAATKRCSTGYHRQRSIFWVVTVLEDSRRDKAALSNILQSHAAFCPRVRCINVCTNSARGGSGFQHRHR